MNDRQDKVAGGHSMLMQFSQCSTRFVGERLHRNECCHEYAYAAAILRKVVCMCVTAQAQVLHAILERIWKTACSSACHVQTPDS